MRKFLSLLMALLLTISFTACSSENAQTDGTNDDSNVISDELDESLTYYADIVIRNYGTVTVELDLKTAPITVTNFVKLARLGFYDGLTFHRIMQGTMIQGGCPEGTGYGNAAETIVGEFSANGYENNLSHTRGAVSMARGQDYNSGSSQFFIILGDCSSWDGQYAVFGYVVEGMEVVDAVCKESYSLPLRSGVFYPQD